MSVTERLIANERSNAVLAWCCVLVVVFGALRSLLAGVLPWSGFALVVALLALVPPAATRRIRFMLPWEVLALAALPVAVRSFTGREVGVVVAYVSVAALSLVLAVELDLFTSVEMSAAFAVGFVVLTTMATAGTWALARWAMDGVLGTGFIASERALMREFVASTVAGVGAGLVFAFYVRRYERLDTYEGP